MTGASVVLGFLNVVVMWLAFRGHRKLAAIGCLLIQVPWTFYDIATRQYGFLLITAFSVLIAGPQLIRGRPKKVTCPKCDGRQGWTVPRHPSYFSGYLGYINEYWNPCPDCGGRGKIPAPVH